MWLHWVSLFLSHRNNYLLFLQKAGSILYIRDVDLHDLFIFLSKWKHNVGKCVRPSLFGVRNAPQLVSKVNMPPQHITSWTSQVLGFHPGHRNSPAEPNLLHFFVLGLSLPTLYRPSLCGHLTSYSPLWSQSFGFTCHEKCCSFYSEHISL